MVHENVADGQCFRFVLAALFFFSLFELHLRKNVGIQSMNQEFCRYCKICRRNLKLGKMIQLMEVSPTRSIILFPLCFNVFLKVL